MSAMLRMPVLKLPIPKLRKSMTTPLWMMRSIRLLKPPLIIKARDRYDKADNDLEEK